MSLLGYDKQSLEGAQAKLKIWKRKVPPNWVLHCYEFGESLFLTRNLTSGKDACQGDSGGALFAQRPYSDMVDAYRRKQLIGIVSFGDKCGTPNKPGISNTLDTKLF